MFSERSVLDSFFDGCTHLLNIQLTMHTILQECVLGEHLNPVHDIAWAPAMGRSYHLIATASRESTFKVGIS